MRYRIIALLVVFAAFLTLGCAGQNNSAPTATPEPAGQGAQNGLMQPAVTTTSQPSAAAGSDNASASPTPVPTIVPANQSGSSGIDPSLADVSGESDDEVSGLDLPTPDAGS